MIANITESLLVVSASRPSWLDETITSAYRIAIQSSADLITTPSEIYDLILLVAADNTLDAVYQAENVRRRFPETAIWLVADNVSIDDYRRLATAGIEDILPGDITTDDMLSRLKESFSTPELDDSTVSTASFSQLAITLDMLHQYAIEPDFIYHALDTISRKYNLVGSLLILKTDDEFTVHALRRDLERSYFTNDKLFIDANDLAYKVLRERQPYIIDTLDSIPAYVQTALPSTREILVVPLIYHNRSTGVLIVCSDERNEFSSEDIHIFKTLTTHLAIALYTTHLVETANDDPSAIRADQDIIVNAWEQFSTKHDSHEIAFTLCNLAISLSCIDSSVVWLPADHTTEHQQAIISASDRQLKDEFTQYHALGGFSAIWQKFNETLEPIKIQQGQVNLPKTEQLFKQFNSSQLICVPIVDTARVNGMLIVSIRAGCHIHETDLSLLGSLAETAGRALERMSLIYAMHEKNSRLEYLLHNISEGTFFIDENHSVVFCNPQFSAVTNIRREDVINKDAQTLFQIMAGSVPGNQSALAELSDMVGTLDQTQTIDVVFNHITHAYRVQLTRVISEHTQNYLWSGIVTQYKANHAPDFISIPTQFADGLQSSLSQINHTLTSLREQSKWSQSVTNQDVLQHACNNVQRLQINWNNLLHFNQLKAQPLKLEREAIDISSFVDLALDMFNLKHHQDNFKISIAEQLPRLKIDITKTATAIAQIIYTFNDLSADQSVTSIAFKQHDNAVAVHIHNPTMVLSTNCHKNVDTLDEDGYNEILNSQDMTQIMLYTCCQIIKNQDGAVHVNADPVKGTTLQVTLPIQQPKQKLPVTEQATAKSESDDHLPMIALIPGVSKLAHSVPHLVKDHYRVKVFANAQKLVEALNETSFKVIMIDALLEQNDSVKVSNLIQQHTKSPIIMLSDVNNIQKRIQAVSQGIQAYLYGTYSPKDLLVEIDDILEKQQLTETTLKEPLQIGDLYIDINRREVLLDNKPLPLARIEYDLLYILATNAGRVLKHEDLLTEIWGVEYRDKKQYLWVNMSRLRKKVHASSKKSYIHTRSGIGYYLQVIA